MTETHETQRVRRSKAMHSFSANQLPFDSELRFQANEIGLSLNIICDLCCLLCCRATTLKS